MGVGSRVRCCKFGEAHTCAIDDRPTHAPIFVAMLVVTASVSATAATTGAATT